MRQLLRQLRERHVIRIATAYLIVAWLVLQVGTVLFSNFGAPPWVAKSFIVIVALGFPVTCVMAWSRDLRPAVAGLPAIEVEVLETPGRAAGTALPRARAAALRTAPAPPRVEPVVPQRSERNAIAVLPLRNASGDPEQTFFAEGITEDIITELSRFHDLLVISRSSSFKHQHEGVSPQTIAAECNVHFVVEGSVRKAGNRVRLTLQLTDTETGAHVWAERYERELTDIFAIQDELTHSIVSVVRGRMEAVSTERAARKATDNMEAYECVLAGKRLHHRSSRDDNARAQALLERAIELDPRYAHAHAWLGCTLGQAFANGWALDGQAQLAKVLASMQAALRLDETDADVHRILAAVYLVQHDFERAWRHQARALELNPNDDLVVVQHGELLTWRGHGDEGIDWIRKAMRLNPYHPERYWGHLGRACFVAHRYAEAVETLQHIAAPNQAQRALLVASFVRLGNAAATASAAQALLQAAPAFSVAGFVQGQHYVEAADREHLHTSLLEAGLPA